MPHVADEDVPAAPALPPGRYGTPRRTPRWLIALVAVVALAALVPVLLSAADKASPDIRGVLTSYVVVDDHTVRATVDVHKPAGEPAVTCTVRARNRYSDVVGTATFTLTGGAASAPVTRSFPTSDEAVVAEVTECRAGTPD